MLLTGYSSVNALLYEFLNLVSGLLGTITQDKLNSVLRGRFAVRCTGERQNCHPQRVRWQLTFVEIVGYSSNTVDWLLLHTLTFIPYSTEKQLPFSTRHLTPYKLDER